MNPALSEVAVLGDQAGRCWLEAGDPASAYASYYAVFERHQRWPLMAHDRIVLLDRLAWCALELRRAEEAQQRLEALGSDPEAPADQRRLARAIRALLAGPQTARGQAQLERALPEGDDAGGDRPTREALLDAAWAWLGPQGAARTARPARGATVSPDGSAPGRSNAQPNERRP